MNRTPRQHEARRRRGVTTAGVLTTLLFVGGCVATAVVVTPRFIDAAPAGLEPPLPARHAKHQTIIDLFGAIVSRSRQVLAIQTPGPTPYTEIVLWLEDNENLGVIDSAEIAVISHSAIMQTVVLYTLGADVAATVAPSDIRARTFCRTWRDREDVTRRVLAHGVSHVGIEEIAGSRNDGLMLRISFTWAADSTDGPDEASVLLDVAMGG